jgi:hypothetical protein
MHPSLQEEQFTLREIWRLLSALYRCIHALDRGQFLLLVLFSAKKRISEYGSANSMNMNIVLLWSFSVKTVVDHRGTCEHSEQNWYRAGFRSVGAI